LRSQDVRTVIVAIKDSMTLGQALNITIDIAIDIDDDITVDEKWTKTTMKRMSTVAIGVITRVDIG